MKRRIAVLLSFLWIISTCPTALAAEASGTTLRLQKTDGNVSVEGRTGRAVTLLEGMRLYSGYAVQTKAKSYAHISLDDTKAVKLDASSKVEVRKSGSKLELNLIHGELLCDVSKQLDKDETLNIRTSTMVTGIRGTTVFFRQAENGQSEIYVLHGTVTVTTLDPVTGENRQVIVTTGQMATTSMPAGGGGTPMTVEAFTEQDIPGYVAVELAENEELQLRLNQQGIGMDIPLIIRDAHEQLAEEQQQEDIRQQELEQVSQIPNSGVSMPLYYSGSGGRESNNPPTSNHPPQNIRTSVTLLAGSTGAELLSALENYDDITVEGCNNNEQSNGDHSITLTGSVVIPANKTLTLNNSTMQVSAEGAIQNNGDVTLSGTSNIYNCGSMNNSGTISINSDSSLENRNVGLCESMQWGTFINAINGIVTINSNGMLCNNGEGTNDGCTLTNFGTITLNANAMFINWGAFNQNGVYYCRGYYSDASVDCYITDNDLVVFRGNLDNEDFLGQITAGRKITLLDDVGPGNGLPENGLPAITTTSTIALNGHSLDLSNVPLTVGSTGNLTITGNNGLELSGNLTGSGTSVISNQGTLIITGGEILANGYEQTAIENSCGNVTMTGGIISAAGTGSKAVAIGASGTFSLQGGVITGAHSTVIESAGAITINGGVVIADGSCAVDLTGGTFQLLDGTVSVTQGAESTVITADNTNVAISGGEIIYNGDFGTALYLRGGQCTMSAGIISAAGSNNVAVKTENSFTISGGTISTIGDGGKALLIVDQANINVIMIDGTVTVYGANSIGVSIGVGSTFTHQGGSIVAMEETSFCVSCTSNIEQYINPDPNKGTLSPDESILILN